MSRRILLVEDNTDNRETLRVLLSLWGFDIQEAGDGPEGVRKAFQFPPDAAVVDIGLPGFDGYEVARRLRQRFGDHIVLIALTAYGSVDYFQRGIEAGFTYYLTKPSDPQQLLSLLLI